MVMEMLSMLCMQANDLHVNKALKFIVWNLEAKKIEYITTTWSSCNEKWPNTSIQQHLLILP